MNPENHVPGADVWKAYIRLSLKLETIDPEGYENLPEAIKRLSHDDIHNLTDSEVQALQAAAALPKSDSYQVTEQNIEVARAYLRLIQKMKSTPAEYEKFPPILQDLADDPDQITNLDSDYVQALRYMNVLPEPIVPRPPKIKTAKQPKRHEEEEPVHENYGGHSHYQDPYNLEKIGEMYSEAHKNFMKSIEKQSDVMGRAFRKAGG